METVQEYLQKYREIGGEAFVLEHDHPFLLYPDTHGKSNFTSAHTQMADRDVDPSVSGSTKSIRDFHVLAPPKPGRKWLVGRSEDREFSIEHSTVSKRHAFIVYEEEQHAYKLGDSGSTNGTYLNGHLVESGEAVFVRDGNIVSFGDCDYLFYGPQAFAEMLDRFKDAGD
ncbi:MAG: FHA domain-containing protein [Deltaproteobacteria bacterium]|nr:FHA domain-containing protein [Deltaproteobacteria bacterium]